MIASVIAKLDNEQIPVVQTIAEVAAHPSLDVGELIDMRLLPVAIETEDQQATESVTRWLQSRPGIEFVDVVFVHFEDENL